MSDMNSSSEIQLKCNGSPKHSRLLISFSGGKTSAYMSNLILNSDLRNHWSEIVVLFANTGSEHEKTLEYVNKCDLQYKFNTIWLEAVIDKQRGKGTRHQVVNFESASRDGTPFERVIEKHGLPNSQFPHCTRETKLNPIKSYLRSIGWKANTYNTAIGIRYDEMDRMSPISMSTGAIYPLIELKISKEQVLEWESQQPVRLGIPEHYGNCVWCWKKSSRKLATIASEAPSAFDFPRRMEALHKDSGAGFGDRRIFRQRMQVEDVFQIAKQPGFQKFVDGFNFHDEALDGGQSCGESCEIGTDNAHDQGI